MDALPFLPFFFIPSKRPSDSDFTPNIISELRVSLARSGRNPDEFHEQLCIFERVRKDVLAILHREASIENFETWPEQMEAYTGQIYSIIKRFKDLKFEGNCWRNSNSASKKYHDDSSWFELATAVWNTASLHSQVAVFKIQEESNLDEGESSIKNACSMFQRCAGILSFLQKKSTESGPSPDLKNENLRLFITLMLQQAQEVIVIKSIRDGMTAKNISKLAWQCADYCERLEGEINNNEFYKSDSVGQEMKKMTIIKMEFYQAISYYSMGCASNETSEYGEAVGYFTKSKVSLESAEKQAGKLGGEYRDGCALSLQYARDVIEGSLTSAVKDNEFIYHMLVNNDVTNPESHNLVKALEWKPEIEPENELFSNLVPDEAFIAASNYTEKTDSLWREISEEINAKNIELEKCKSSLEAAGINVGHEKPRDHLPDDLIEAIAKESDTKHLLERIKSKMENLQTKDQTFDQNIKHALDIVQNDEADTLKCPETSRGQLNDPGWAAIKKRISEIEKAFQDSKQPTVMFISAAKVSTQNLQVLAQGMDHVKSQLPALKTLEGEEKEAVELVTKLVSKIAEMESQRKDLGTKLRLNLDNDDITGHLAGEPEHTHGDIYTRELKKHDDVCAYIRQNLAAQENILSVLDDARLNFAHVYKRQREENQRYDDKINQLVLASQSSNEIVTKMENGGKFLENLEQELIKISGVLEAAKSMRDKIRSKILVPARPKNPKPKPKPKGINDDLMAELKELGMDNDPEFLEFLSQGGDLGTIMPPKSIPKLPGIPQSAVRHAMNPNQSMYYPPQQAQTPQYRPQGPSPQNLPQEINPHPTAPSHAPNVSLSNSASGPRLSAVEQFHKNMERMKSSKIQQPQSRLPPSSITPSQAVTSHGFSSHEALGQLPPPVRNIPTEDLHGSVPPVSIQGGLPPNQPLSPKPKNVFLPQDDTLARERAELEKERKRLADEKQKQEIILQNMKAMEQQRLRQEQQFQQQQKDMMEKLQNEKMNNQRQQQMLEQQRIQQKQQLQYQQQQIQKQMQHQLQQQQQHQQNILLDQQKKAQQHQQDAMKSQKINYARSLAPQPNSLTPSRSPVILSPINHNRNGHSQSVCPDPNLQSAMPGAIRASSPSIVSQYQNLNLSTNQMQPRLTQNGTHTLFNGISQDNMNSTTDDWLMKYRKPAETNTTSSTQKNLRYPSQPYSVIPSARYQSPSQPSTQQRHIPQQITQQYQPIRQSYQPMNAQYNNNQQPNFSSNSIRQVQPGQQINQTSSISSNQSSSIPANLPPPLLSTTASSFSSLKLQQPVRQTKPVQTVSQVKPDVGSPETNQHTSKALSNFDLLSDLTSMAEPEPIQSIPQPKLVTEAEIIANLQNLKTSRNEIKNIPPELINALSSLHFPDETIDTAMKSMAAAKLSQQQNRQNIILPFDSNRVVLSNRPNDNINCSRIQTGSSAIPMVLAGEIAPHPEDLWSLIWSEKTEMLTVIHSKQEARNEILFNWLSSTGVLSDQNDLNLGDFVVSTKLTSSSNECKSYQMNISKNQEKRCLSLYVFDNFNPHLNVNSTSLAKLIKLIANRFVQQRSKSTPPLIISTCGGPRVGTVLFGLVVALELQVSNFDVRQLIHIFQNISLGRQFILSKKQTDEAIRAIQLFNSV